MFLDAIIFLRALVDPIGPESRRLNQTASGLLRHTGRGEVEVATSDAVLAEVALILTARAHRQLPASVAAGFISAIVQLRGFRRSEKRAILRTLEIWVRSPRLGFIDAVTLAHVQAPGMQFATFYSDFDNLPGVDRWQSSDVG